MADVINYQRFVENMTEGYPVEAQLSKTWFMRLFSAQGFLAEAFEVLNLWYISADFDDEELELHKVESFGHDRLLAAELGDLSFFYTMFTQQTPDGFRAGLPEQVIYALGAVEKYQAAQELCYELSNLIVDVFFRNHYKEETTKELEHIIKTVDAVYDLLMSFSEYSQEYIEQENIKKLCPDCNKPDTIAKTYNPTITITTAPNLFPSLEEVFKNIERKNPFKDFRPYG